MALGDTIEVEDYQRVYTQDRVLESMQDSVQRSLSPLTRIPFLNGRLIEDISMTAATTNEIAHGLGRAYRGWFVVDIDAASTVHRDTSSTSSTTEFLPLQASATSTMTIWVF